MLFSTIFKMIFQVKRNESVEKWWRSCFQCDSSKNHGHLSWLLHSIFNLRKLLASTVPEYESRIQAAFVGATNGTYKNITVAARVHKVAQQTLNDRSKGILPSHGNSSNRLKRKLSKIGWLMNLVPHALSTLTIYVPRSTRLVEGFPAGISIVVTLFVTRSLFLLTSHGILT
ncbi:hypothetical protein BDR04DRAFT_1145695 [Suillus decipiens]|nr:hypothetical protein BDR04DRAFT_1145695 [Suillus decipiens]